MRWTKYEEYTHEKFMDVHIRIEKIQFLGPEYIKLKIKWIHNRLGELDLPAQSIKIMRKDFDKWSLL